jgi:type IV pilus assembly protein PilQ
MIQASQFFGGILTRHKRLLAALALLLGVQTGAMAQANSIDSITTTQQGQNLVVKLTFNHALSGVPAGFAVETPPRIALDFLGTSNNIGRNSMEANEGELRSINIVQAGDRTRVVFNLKRLIAYSQAIEGNSLLVTLAPTSADGSTPVVTTTGGSRFAEATAIPGQSVHALRDIDFKRGADGQGRVVIDLSDSQTGVDIKTQGQSIVVDFLNTQLPENLRRRLNVADFGTPVQTVNTFTQGDNTRMVIEPHGLWEHNAYQTDNRLVIEVKPVTQDPNKLFPNGRPGYQGERLSLNFQNVEVRSLLQVIADFTNLNIITSDSVGGNLTLRLKDVPWDQALDIILQAKGLDMRKNGNVILVAPKDELATKEKLDLEAKQQISELEPLRSEVFQLNYQKADNMRAFLNGDPVPGASGAVSATGGSSGAASRVLSKRGAASADPRTNQLFVQDIASKLEQVRDVIARLDVPSRQVLIEARVVVADDGFVRQLGSKLGYVNNNPAGEKLGSSGYNTQVSNSYNSLGVGQSGLSNVTGLAPTGYTPATASQVATGSAFQVPGFPGYYTGTTTVTQGTATVTANQPFVSLPANGAATVASVAFSLFRAGSTRALNLELSALEQDDHGKLISSPRVVTADQVKALIEQGTEIPYQIATSSGATAIQFQKANLKLEVTPQITPEGNIILTVDVTDDSVGTFTTGLGYAIDTKHVNTQVLVENGGTVVLGGIYTLVDRDDVNKVPFFGDIPYIGFLFKNSTRTYQKTELLIFLTPRVISDKVSAG